MKQAMNPELKQVRDDFLSLMIRLQRDSKEKHDPEREYVARVLAMLAGAIQEGQMEQLANYIYEWGRKHLVNWKQPE